MDDIDSISCQVLKRKQCHEDESIFQSKKRRTVESSFLPFSSCTPTMNQAEMTPSFPENECKVLDCQLAEELLGCVTPNEGDSCKGSNVITLLTPPASPI